MRITSDGNIGVNTTPTAIAGFKILEVKGSTANSGGILKSTSANGSYAVQLYTASAEAYMYTDQAIPLVFYTTGTERMRLNSDGRLLLGVTSDQTGNPGFVMKSGNRASLGNGQFRIGADGLDNGEIHSFTNTPNPNLTIGYGTGAGGLDTTKENALFNAGTIAFRNSNVSVSGNLSKGSGSFKIDHPLTSKTNTHFLVHSFIEGPKADLIYRGKVSLVNGTATVNIDTVSKMTEGTFVLLNREVQCFTSNETGWIAVKGSVSGNTLTINAQDNNCNDTISWLVIGERQDKHIYETNMTDNDGKVIVEPKKKIEDDQNIIFKGVIKNA